MKAGKVGLFMPHVSVGKAGSFFYLKELLSERLSGLGAEINDDYDCLCRYDENVISEEGVNVAIFHPHTSGDLDKCYGNIKRIVEKNPGVDFYLFTIDVLGRREAIGGFPNLRYIHSANRKDEDDKEFIQKLREKLSKL